MGTRKAWLILLAVFFSFLVVVFLYNRRDQNKIQIIVNTKVFTVSVINKSVVDDYASGINLWRGAIGTGGAFAKLGKLNSLVIELVDSMDKVDDSQRTVFFSRDPQKKRIHITQIAYDPVKYEARLRIIFDPSFVSGMNRTYALDYLGRLILESIYQIKNYQDKDITRMNSAMKADFYTKKGHLWLK